MMVPKRASKGAVMKEPINYSLRWFLGAVANFIRALARILISRVEGKNLRCQLAAS